MALNYREPGVYSKEVLVTQMPSVSPGALNVAILGTIDDIEKQYVTTLYYTEDIDYVIEAPVFTGLGPQRWVSSIVSIVDSNSNNYTEFYLKRDLENGARIRFYANYPPAGAVLTVTYKAVNISPEVHTKTIIRSAGQDDIITDMYQKVKYITNTITVDGLSYSLQQYEGESGKDYCLAVDGEGRSVVRWLTPTPPVQGTEYVVSYVIIDYMPKFYNTLSLWCRDYGYESNLGIAGQLAFTEARALGNYGRFYGVPVQRNTETGIESITTVESALRAIETLPIDLFVVVLDDRVSSSDWEAIHNRIYMHIVFCSSEENRNERKTFLGMPKTATDVDYKNRAVSIAQRPNSWRLSLVFPRYFITQSVVDSAGEYKEKNLNSTFLAAALAGSVSGQPDVATPIVRRQLVTVKELAKRFDGLDYTRADLNNIAVVQSGNIVAGITIIEAVEEVARVRDSLTCDQSSKENGTLEVTLIRDYVTKRERQVVEKAIGQKMVGGRFFSIKVSLKLDFADLIDKEIVEDWKENELIVMQDPKDPTAIIVNCEYKPVYPCKYVSLFLKINSAL